MHTPIGKRWGGISNSRRSGEAMVAVLNTYGCACVVKEEGERGV